MQQNLKKMLIMKFHSKPPYNQKYIKAKVKTFDGIVNTIFWNEKLSKENANYTCIAAVSIDSVMRMDKKSHSKCI